jgi:Intra-flagellar transport protein 57
MWENSLEKLKVLNYEMGYCGHGKGGRKPFSRIHFVYPGSNAGTQFQEFIDICSWLCSEIDRRPDFFHVEDEDDPNTMCNKLLLALRKLDFKSSFPSQKLRAGHGEIVCSVLDFLTDKALDSKGFKWGTPIYSDANEVSKGLCLFWS